MRILWIFLFGALLLVGVRARATPCERPAFGDQALVADLQAASELLVYVWSPLMPLSVVGRDELLEFAHEGFAVRSVMDPSARLCEVATQEPRLNSGFLLAHSALNHFPTLFYFRQGDLVLTLHGYESSDRLRARLMSLREAGAVVAPKGSLP